MKILLFPRRGRRRFPLLVHTVRHRFIVWYTVRIDSSCIRRGPHRKRRATKCGPPCKQGATNVYRYILLVYVLAVQPLVEISQLSRRVWTLWKSYVHFTCSAVKKLIFPLKGGSHGFGKLCLKGLDTLEIKRFCGALGSRCGGIGARPCRAGVR